MPCPEKLMKPFGLEMGNSVLGWRVLLPSCLAMVAMPGGEIRGFMNLLHDIHHFLSSKGIFNHMELALKTIIKDYYY